MADGIRLDLQEALARGPSGIPNLEPLFAPGAIPPIFDEAPEVQEGPGFAPEEGPIALPGTSVGQPVPPVKQSRGDRLRALLGNFLQNFGTGLQAASRAPSGAEFAAGFGGALSAGEERRQQKSREELLRANQAFREQFARERAELDAERFEFTQRQAEAGRIERNLDRAERGREREEGRRTRGFRDVLESNRARRARAGQRLFRREERLGAEKARAEEGKKGRQLTRELAKLRGTGERKQLTTAQALTQARLEVAEVTKADALKLGSDRLFSGEEGIKRLQEVINERVTELLGRKPTQGELKEVFDQTKVDSVLADIERAKKANFTEDDLTALVVRFHLANEINSLERDKIMEEAGLAPETLSEVEIFRRNIGRREQIEGSRKTRIPGTLPSFLRKIR